MPVPPMDVFGIVYIIENAQQFWSELEDILILPKDLTLSKLDAMLRRFVSFCAAYHEQYLQSPLQLEHACDILLASELFAFHSERMCELLVEDAQTNTDPHCEMMLYHVLLSYGRRHPAFLRSQKRWQPLLPLLMDHVRLDVDPEVEDAFYGASGSGSGGSRAIAVPIEAKLRSLSVRLLYEVCRVQSLSLHDLRIFDDAFIDYLFELVEQTRDMHDETFNYSVIKLIVALNEQFMVASLHPVTPLPTGKSTPPEADAKKPEGMNRVLRVLMSRIGSSMTFGENLIFMLNRADRTAEDLCMQLLVLKILYLLFTTKGMSEYFYTNDLCVLVDVFLREIGNIDEDNESLRHTYLRVLHPLLTKTQLRTMPYKRPQVVRVLESLVEHEAIRDVDPTTKRLVARCLGGDWCVQFRTEPASKPPGDCTRRVDSPGIAPPHSAGAGAAAHLDRQASLRGKPLKTSRSAENLNILVASTAPKLRVPPSQLHQHAHAHVHQHQHKTHGRALPPESSRHTSVDSSSSLPLVAAAVPGPARRTHRASAADLEVAVSALSTHDASEPSNPPRIRVLAAADAMSITSFSSTSTESTDVPGGQRRSAPAPPKRRKPPAVPAGRMKGAALVALASTSQPNLTTLASGARKASVYQAAG